MPRPRRIPAGIVAGPLRAPPGPCRSTKTVGVAPTESGGYQMRANVKRTGFRLHACMAALALAGIAGCSSGGGTALGQTVFTRFQQVNLVSDVPGLARVTDSNLVNPWGLSASIYRPFWIADNNS